MEAVGAAASIATILKLSAGVIKYISAVHGANSERDRICREIIIADDCLDTIKSLLEGGKVEEEWLSTVDSMFRSTDGPLSIYRAALTVLEKKLERSSGIRKAAQTLIWPFQKEEISNALQAISRAKSFFNLALQMDNTRLLMALKGDTTISTEILKSVQPQINETGRDVKEVLEASRGDVELKVCAWISDFAFQERHQDICRSRLAGSGQWLLNSATYQTWRNGKVSDRLLWCSGIPGAGKTVMSSLIIDDLMKNFRGDGYGIAYFYCDFRKSSSQDAEMMIASLLKQLASQKTPLPELLIDLYKRKKRIMERLTLQDFDTIAPLLIDEARQAPSAFVVIDALDECDNPKERKKFFHFLSSIRPCTKILVTSRKGYSDITNYMETALHINIEADEEDVRKYLTEEIKSDDDFSELIGSELRTQVVDKIIGSSGGMFLLPTLQLRSLASKETRKQIRTAIEHLPTDLGELLKDTLDRIQHSRWKDTAIRALAWVSFAKRPLKIDELRHALAIQPGEQDLDEDSLTTANIIIGSCLGLIIKDDATSTLRLAHLSVRDYLLARSKELFPEGHLAIAKACLHYLTLNAFSEGRRLQSNGCEIDEDRYPLLFYAAQFWGQHWRDAGDPDNHPEAIGLLQDSDLVNHTLQFEYWADWPAEARRKLMLLSPNNWSGMHLAARFNLPNTIRTLLRNGFKVSAQTEFGETSLHSACNFGSLEAAEVLVENGGDIHSTCLQESPQNIYNCELKKYWSSSGLVTPLHLAAKYGSEPLVRLLLEKGANVYADTKEGHTPLTMSISPRTNSSVVNLLIDKGPNLLERNCESGTALHLVVKLGQTSVAKLLLNRGANINCRTEKGSTPLMLSAMHGQATTADLLIKQDADLFAVDEDQNTALFYAADSNLDTVVDEMLRRGAKINRETISTEQIASFSRTQGTRKVLMDNEASFKRKDENGRTALHWICAFGASEEPIQAVKFFIENGADPDARDDDGVSPLWYAACQMWPNVISFLLERGARLDVQSSYGRTILHQAIVVGDKDIVEQILAHQSALETDWESYSELRETPLMTAVDCGHLAIVKVLVGRDPSALLIANRWGNYPVAVACQAGRMDIAEFLLSQHRLPLDEPLRYGRTLLIIAAAYGQIEMVKFLIEHKASLDKFDDDNMGVLYHAAYSGNADLVSFLLKQKLNVNSIDKYQSTPLLHAIANNRSATANVLLENGADINAKNILKQFPLASACRNSGPELILALLAKDADTMALTCDDNTVIHEACSAPTSANLKTILNVPGPSVQARNQLGNTALHEAILSNSAVVEKIFLLCEAGCDIDALNNDKETALHIAAKGQQETAVWALLEHKCRFDLRDKDGNTAIECIQQQKNYATFQWNALEEDPIPEKYDRKGYFREKPLEKLRRVIRSIQADRVLRSSLRAPHPEMPRDPTQKLRFLVEKFKPKPLSVKELLDPKSQRKSTKNRSSSRPENLLKQLRRIERLLTSYCQEHGQAFTVSQSSLLVSQIESRQISDLKVANVSSLDINEQDEDKVTPIYAAASIGSHRLVDQSLKLGADPNIPNRFLDTALHVAVREGELHIVFRLLQSERVNIHARNQQGNTPLHVTTLARKENLALMRLLLQKGARVDDKNNDGETALVLAIASGSEPLVQSLLESQADANACNKVGESLLHLAIMNKQESLVKTLLAREDMDIHKKDCQGFSAVHQASVDGSHQTFLDLVSKGADVEAITTDGNSCLHWAAYGNQHRTAEYLVRKSGFDPCLPNRRSGAAPLHLACSEGSNEVILFLLAQGVSVDLLWGVPQASSDADATNDGSPANHNDDKKQHNDVTDSPDVMKNEDAGTANTDENIIIEDQDIAKKSDNLTIIDDNTTDDDSSDIEPAPENYARAGSTPLILAAATRSGDDDIQASICALLLRRGATIDARTSSGETALMCAAALPEGYGRVVSLLEKNADVNARNENGLTALHFAAHKEGFLTTNYLLKHGADASIQDNSGRTPLAYARALKKRYEEAIGYNRDWMLYSASMVGEVVWILEKMAIGEKI